MNRAAGTCLVLGLALASAAGGACTDAPTAQPCHNDCDTRAECEAAFAGTCASAYFALTACRNAYQADTTRSLSTWPPTAYTCSTICPRERAAYFACAPSRPFL